MPIPGGAYALQQNLTYYPSTQRSQRRSSLFLPGRNSPTDDPKILAFNETQRFLKSNLKCSMVFFKDTISSSLDKIHGVLVLEAKLDIAHSGMFILMKGLTLPPKKRNARRVEGGGGKPVTSLKFVVLGYTTAESGDIIIEGSCRESYPLELNLPKKMEDLPPPLITMDGKLMYKLQLFMTCEGRHVQVGETKLQYEGYYNLSENSEEVERPLRIVLQVQTKRSILGLGRRKTVNLEVAAETSGYLPQEIMGVTMVARTHDKTSEMECKMEIIQKVWYQAPVPQGRRMSVKMKINSLAKTDAFTLKVEPGKETLWEGSLQVPKEISPTYKYDFMNSVSYILRVTVGILGEKDGVVVGESPLFIGSTKSEEQGIRGSDEEDEVTGGRWSSDASPCRSGAATPQMRSSLSLTFIPFRDRLESISSIRSGQSQGSSYQSIFRPPPSYSQISSRRPTLETLPPAYGELEMQERSSLLQDADGEKESE